MLDAPAQRNGVHSGAAVLLSVGDTPFGQLEPAAELDLRTAGDAGQERPDHTELRVALQLVGGERLQPSAQRCLLSPSSDLEPVFGDQLSCVVVVARRCRVLDGIGDQPAIAVPGARPSVKDGNPIGMAARELAAEHLSEQVVVAVPRPRVVKRHEEHVRTRDLLERAPSRPVGDRLAQRAAQPIDNRGVQQELAGLVAELVEHHLAEVVDNMTVVTGEPLDVGVGTAASAQPQRREIQTSGPPLGARSK